LYENRVMHLTLANEQQCFVEGCVQIFALHITAHRPPTFVVLSPNPPNLMTLALTDLDLYITGSISGQLQLLPPIPISFPVAGTLSVKAVRVEVNVVLDLQKNNDDKPYIRTVSCYIRKGDISAKVENMGLITDIVNFKYKDEMGEKAHEVLQRTVCGNVEQIVEEEFNNRIAKLPNVLSVKEMVQTFVVSDLW
uniref:Arrestin_C domain-containing protein n=1 Tax=Anisakis simplex TaxID=6269 RepID=A0A0M3KFM5_ANISI